MKKLLSALFFLSIMSGGLYAQTTTLEIIQYYPYSITLSGQQYNETATAKVKNISTNTLNEVSVSAKVTLNGSSTALITFSSDTSSIVAPGDSILKDIPIRSSVMSAVFDIHYFVVYSQSDTLASSDTLIQTFAVSESELARDDSSFTHSWFIPSEQTVGHVLAVYGNTTVTGVKCHIASSTASQTVSGSIWSMSAGVPNAQVATLDTISSSSSPGWFNIPISGGNASLTTGEYLICVKGIGSDIEISTCDGVFTPSMAMIDSLGSWVICDSMHKTPAIRIYVASCQTITPNENISNTSCPSCSDGSICVSPSGGNAPYTYEWSSGSTTDCATGLAAGFYLVTITDALGCTQNGFYMVEPGGVGIHVTDEIPVRVFPNPAQSFIRIEGFSANENILQCALMSADGNTVCRYVEIEQHDGIVYLNLNCAPGMYLFSIVTNARMVTIPLVRLIE